jgi:phage FluMu protein Com
MRSRVVRCDFCGDVIRGNPSAAMGIICGTCPRCFDEFVGPNDAPPEIDFQMPIELEVCRG